MSDVGKLTEDEQRAFEERPTLLAAAQRCNRYRVGDYLPVFVEDVKVGEAGRGEGGAKERGGGGGVGGGWRGGSGLV